MAINASVMTGSTNQMAMGHPFAGPTGPRHRSTGKPIGGVPIMIDVRTREVIVIDPWLLKDGGIIHSPFGIILGPKGDGKSTTMKVIANRLSMLTAGYDMMRVAINDYKPEGATSEYELFTKHMRSKVFRIADMRVNPFESRLFATTKDIDHEVNSLAVLRVAELMFEFVNSGALLGFNAESLRIAVGKMMRYDELLWAPALLFHCLRSLSDQDIEYYYDELRTLLNHQMQLRVEAVADDSVHDSLIEQIHDINAMSSNLDYEDIKRAGVYVSTLFGNILHGSYGKMFGADHSWYDMITQRVVTKDWRDVPQAAETLIRTIDTEIKIAAIENNRLDLLPHIELDDELHKSMGNLVYATAQSHLSEIARGTHICNIGSTHRLGSIRRGAVGSDLYNLGSTIINNLGFALIGRHEATDPGLDELVERYELAQVDRAIITSLPKYTFGLKLGDEPIRYGRVFALPSEMEFIGTNAATDRMVDRPGVLYPDKLLTFAEANGIVRIAA